MGRSFGSIGEGWEGVEVEFDEFLMDEGFSISTPLVVTMHNRQWLGWGVGSLGMYQENMRPEIAPV